MIKNIKKKKKKINKRLLIDKKMCVFVFVNKKKKLEGWQDWLQVNGDKIISSYFSASNFYLW